MSTEEDQMAEAWRRAGFKVIGGGRPYWTQKLLMTRSLAVICGLLFGFIGYVLGMEHGLAAEAVGTALFGFPGAVFGYGFALSMIYSGRAVAARKLKKLQQQ